MGRCDKFLRRFERIPNFITRDEADELIAWIDTAIEDGYLTDAPLKSVGGYDSRLTSRNYDGDVPFPQVAYDIRQRILDTFEWTPISKIEPINQGKGVMAIITRPGGDTKPHYDPLFRNPDNPQDFMPAVRFNIILQNAEKGGELYVEGENRACDELELHAYNVTRLKHWVTKVEGEKPRYIFLFGMLIPNDDWEFKKVRKKLDVC